jgi:hypothetical protein
VRSLCLLNIVLNLCSPLKIPRRRWEDNIKIDLKEKVIDGGFGWLRIGSGGGIL